LFDDVQRLARERPTAGNGHDPQRSAGYAGMIIDPHTHMISRTTDDYEAMARAGVVAVIEPAFWLGQPRTSVGSFIDYFTMISGFERFRASSVSAITARSGSIRRKRTTRPWRKR
jgi:hypothetical protein